MSPLSFDCPIYLVFTIKVKYTVIVYSKRDVHSPPHIISFLNSQKTEIAKFSIFMIKIIISSDSGAKPLVIYRAARGDILWGVEINSIQIF